MNSGWASCPPGPPGLLVLPQRVCGLCSRPTLNALVTMGGSAAGLPQARHTKRLVPAGSQPADVAASHAGSGRVEDAATTPLHVLLLREGGGSQAEGWETRQPAHVSPGGWLTSALKGNCFSLADEQKESYRDGGLSRSLLSMEGRWEQSETSPTR